ncbi:MAG: asparaginase [Candidatus Gastranaerophilales bacterium]|nr:asparaginase [Candidatus Gastranaerophilales bacterium]
MRIEYLRDGLVEEFHDGICIRLNEIDTEPYFLRSCAKPLQASLIIDAGVDFTDEELAFCSGSHAGEECHIKLAHGILDKLGLDESFLKCGVHEPLARSMQDKMLLRGEKASAIHNNCSGKHLGFLAVCKVNGWDLETYYEPEHPLQIAVKKRIYELCEVNEFYASPLMGEAGRSSDEGGYPMTTDGCGVPIVSMPLNNLVKGFKNLNEKYPQIVNAILKNPYIYGGENRLDTEIIEKTELLAKVGAGGLCVVFNQKLNDGFAVKMFDASMPARRFAVFDMINRLGWANVEIDNKIRTLSWKIVGEVKVLN